MICYTEIEKKILKLIWKYERPRTANATLQPMQPYVKEAMLEVSQT
jgi:hypothetical protein